MRGVSVALSKQNANYASSKPARSHRAPRAAVAAAASIASIRLTGDSQLYIYTDKHPGRSERAARALDASALGLGSLTLAAGSDILLSECVCAAACARVCVCFPSSSADARTHAYTSGWRARKHVIMRVYDVVQLLSFQFPSPGRQVIYI